MLSLPLTITYLQVSPVLQNLGEILISARRRAGLVSAVQVLTLGQFQTLPFVYPCFCIFY